jgi:hypothetical protein
METIVPWAALCQVIEPHYPKAGNGRPPIGLERMLRIHFLQHWFNLADLACEEALYDSASLRRFVGIDLGRERVPDATTLLKFRKLLNEQQTGRSPVCQGRPAIAGARLQGQHRHHRGCHHHRSAQLHQERRQGARPRYAPDPQRPAMVFRHEAAHWRGQPKRAGAQRRGDGGQRARQTPTARSAAWQRAARVRRLGLCQPESTDSEQGPQGQGLHQPAHRAVRARWTKCSGPRTATSRGCVLGSSMSLRWSSACGDSPRCAIAGCRRTPRVRSRPWRWPTFTCAAGRICWDRCARKGGNRASRPRELPKWAAREAKSPKNCVNAPAAASPALAHGAAWQITTACSA